MEHQPPHFQSEAALPILNKVGRIAALPVLRNILGQTSPKFDMAKALNHRWILIANVAPPELENRSVLIANLGQGADRADRGAGVQFARLTLALTISNSSPWRVATRPPRPGRHSSPKSTSSRVSAPTRSLRYCRKLANSQHILSREPVPPTGTSNGPRRGARERRHAHRLSHIQQRCGIVGTGISSAARSRAARSIAASAWFRRDNASRRPIFLEPSLYPPRSRRDYVVAQSRCNFDRARTVIERTPQDGLKYMIADRPTDWKW
jgi:hypothetical protein